jgi:enterochelin esterase-like enzyme
LFKEVDGKKVLDTKSDEKWTAELLINKINKDIFINTTVVLDHGSKDFLVSQSREFVKALNDLNISVTYKEFDGGHTDRFRNRFEGFVLPFFSKIFN